MRITNEQFRRSKIIDFADSICSIFNLITSPKNFKDFSKGFRHENEENQGECSVNIEQFSGRFHVRKL